MLQILESFSPPSIIPGIEARLFVALAFTAAATYFDVFNKKWVPNTLLYAFAAAAFLVNIAYFEQGIFVQALAFGIAAFLLSYPLYRAGQLGGADMFCYSSIAMAIPYLPQPLLAPQSSAPYPFILSVLIPTGIVFIAHMIIRFLPYVYSQAKKGRAGLTATKLVAPAILAIAFAVFMSLLLSLPVQLPPAYFVLLAFLFAALLFFSLFKDLIKGSMVENLPPSRLLEEDVLALEKMDSKAVSRLGLSPLLNAKAIAAIRKAKLKSVPVYTKMPFFLPYLLVGLVVAILFGDLISHLAAGF